MIFTIRFSLGIFLLILLSSKSFAAHGISTFGDLKYPKNFQHFDYVNPDAPKGGEVKFGSEGGFNSLNNFILKGLPASGLNYLYDSLTEGSEDEISARYALIAEDIKIASNKSWIEFRLNKNARFHDGKSITADDVIFTFDKLISDGHPSYKMLFRDVKEAKKINSHLVRFSFKPNGNRDLPLLVASLPVLPKHYFNSVDFSKTTLQPPLGSGPYKIKDLKPNRSITFERVKDYWAKDLPVNRGRYNFDKITFDYYRDNNVLIEAFKSQKYDFRQENVARNWANAYNIDAIKNGEIIKREIEHGLPAPMQTFVLNLRREKFQNQALRQAMTYAFDFEWLREHIFYKSYKRTESYFANSEFGYQNFSLPKANSDGFNRDNLLKARQILLDANYKFSDGKLIDPKTNEKVSVEFLIDSQAFEMIVAPFIKNLRKLGIEAKMRFVEENQYQTRVNNFDFDVITGMFGQATIPGDELFAYFHSSQKDIKGGRNLSGLNDKIIDDLVEKISRAKNKNELQILTSKLDQRLLVNYYTIPQWHNNTYRILYRDIFEFPKIQPKYSLALDSWYLKTN
ncbi:MAG: extracellular solute-binding protein [Proteobacteria bacterium]|nr:extracellular solute-binding protein [Pseudomonadota bacterium]